MGRSSLKLSKEAAKYQRKAKSVFFLKLKELMLMATSDD